MNNGKKNLKDICTFLQSKKGYILGLKPGFHTVTVRLGIVLEWRNILCRNIVVKIVLTTYISKNLYQAKIASEIVIVAVRPV